MEPSPNVERLIFQLSKDKSMSEGMRTMMERKSEFPNLMAAQLTGIMLDPYSAEAADETLDRIWRLGKASLLRRSEPVDEVIIGSGFHAATYSAIRVLSGFPKPLVIEQSDRVGGVFAYSRPVFYLNSRTRKGGLGSSGDSGSNLNYLPGAPIQSSNLAVGEYQTNQDMARVIRLTLAQYANVIPGEQVFAVEESEEEDFFALQTGSGVITARRIIDARGLGQSKDKQLSNGKTIITFEQFMERMTQKWPLRGIKRAAVLGAGDSARCAIESLLGLAPSPMMGSFLDSVERVDVYGNIPSSFDSWCNSERPRYRAIGQFLKPDKYGVSKLRVFRKRETPIDIPGSPSVAGKAYDLIVLCTGNSLPVINGLNSNQDFVTYRSVTGMPLCLKNFDQDVYRIGPAANLGFTLEETEDGIDRIRNNRVAMFRLASKTATLATQLPKPERIL